MVETVGRVAQPARIRRTTPATSSSRSGRVDEDQLVDRQHVAQPREPVDELRRVRRAAADDGELHPLTPVSVTPSMKALWAMKKSAITGAMTRAWQPW